MSDLQPTETTTDVPPMDTPKAKSPQPTTTPQRARGGRNFIVGALLVLLCALGGFVGARIAVQGNTVASSPASTNNDAKSDGNSIVTQSEQDISGVVDKVSPSVVSIVTTEQSARGAEQSAGTGIIISKDGYIITNHHVVGSASSAQVVSSDGKIYKNVKVVGSDSLNDIAFLKIDGATNLKPASIGNSSTVHVGQQVVAIGNALGQYQNTVSSGIISGTGRPVSASDGDTTENLTDLIQTDAAINSGNSGGPLLNIAGQVVGINTAVAQDAQGIGFAIPINAAKGEIASVVAGKGVKRAYIGVNYLSVTADVAANYDLPVKQGAYIYSKSGSPIASGSPAAKANLKNKDIITAVNGTKIGSAGSLSTLVGEYQPGDTIELTVLRGDKKIKVKVTLAEYTGSANSSYRQDDYSYGDQDQSFFDQLFGQ